jgi:UDP-N-acetylmuramate dehydrogenase
MKAGWLPNWRNDVAGADVTTMKVGGPLLAFVKVSSEEEFKTSLAMAKKCQWPVKVIGAGSNLLFADEGFHGLVMQLPSGEPEILAEKIDDPIPSSTAVGRYAPEQGTGFLQLPDGDKEVTLGAPVLVEVLAGHPWAKLVAWSLREKLYGLQWFARIPCQVGGGVYNNIHGQKHLLSQYIYRVRSFDPQKLYFVDRLASQLKFSYDYSIFHTLDEIIWSVTFVLPTLSDDNAHTMQELYLEWTKAKSTIQPSGANAGSVFQNLTSDELPDGLSALSAAWYIDQCGFKGRQIGGMLVYPKHANFIINTGGGTQADFLALTDEIRQAVFQRFGVTLHLEIECVDSEGRKMKG